VHPVLWKFEILGRPITLYSFGLVIVVAFLVAAYYARARASRRLGLDKERVFNVAFALLFVGIAGARVLYVVVHYATYAKDPLSFLKIWDGGMSLYGGLLAGVLWLGWYLPRHPELKGFALADVLAIASCLAIFVGAWGSLLSGDAYGKPTDAPWGITFPPGETTPAPRGVALHPTQVYHALHGILAYLVLVLYLKKPRPSGRAFGLFLILYGVGRSLVEVWRGDDAHRGMVIDGVLSVPQLLSVPVLFAGVAIWLIRKNAAPASAAPVPLPAPAHAPSHAAGHVRHAPVADEERVAD
jgi:phosphatidylglycerol:prolipoprotein diacylglycerol transferase